MSCSTVLAITPDKRPTELAELRNSHGWGPNVWSRLIGERWWLNDGQELDALYVAIDTLPQWQQVPLLLTSDLGILPARFFEWGIDSLLEFEARVPSDPKYVNHVPAVIEILKAGPEADYVGVWGTSVTENPFDPWVYDEDEPGCGLPLSAMWTLSVFLDAAT